MKNAILYTAVIAILASASPLAETAWGQAKNSSPSLSHKVGLIDMAHIFKEYQKFKVLREDLKQEIEQSDSKAKAMAEGIKSVQAEIQTYSANSPEYINAERKLAKSTSDFEAFRKLAQREFLRKESQIYKTIYLEVTDMVEKYAEHYKYTLIIRFNREGLQETAEPSEVIKSMNRQVVYFRPNDDITSVILDHLNNRYAQGGKSASKNRGTRQQ